MISDKSRRKFLQGFSNLVGAVTAGALLTGNSMSVALAYTQQADSTSAPGKIFSQSQLKLLKQICALVIPRSETLGAADVDTHGFIDNQLSHCFDKAEQKQIIRVLELLDHTANKTRAMIFIDLPLGMQFDLLTKLDQGVGVFDKAQRGDFKALKRLICFGYYTSEVGASQELRYVAVPGGFKGSITYKGSDASWGSMGLYY